MLLPVGQAAVHEYAVVSHVMVVYAQLRPRLVIRICVVHYYLPVASNEVQPPHMEISILRSGHAESIVRPLGSEIIIFSPAEGLVPQFHVFFIVSAKAEIAHPGRAKNVDAGYVNAPYFLEPVGAESS